MYHKDPRWLKRYVDFHRNRLEDRLGQGPLDVRIVVKVAEIPGPTAHPQCRCATVLERAT